MIFLSHFMLMLCKLAAAIFPSCLQCCRWFHTVCFAWWLGWLGVSIRNWWEWGA